MLNYSVAKSMVRVPEPFFIGLNPPGVGHTILGGFFMPSGIYKRKPVSNETKRKISIKTLGNKRALGCVRSPETRKKMSIAAKLRMTPEYIEKMRIRNSGSNSSFWRGGISTSRELIRKSIKYRAWRTSIYKRDNFTCQWCGVIGGRLEAHHHNKTFSSLYEEARKSNPLLSHVDSALAYEPLWDINNGITLCVKCHNKTKKGGATV